jgi:hypothetical protein
MVIGVRDFLEQLTVALLEDAHQQFDFVVREGQVHKSSFARTWFVVFDERHGCRLIVTLARRKSCD